ncbi:hypothetical protein [Streptomyces atratus]|uniref:hypothetical protein n=1 Tax=Streptomyces atratus TaxID=1893 RepID=UPI002252735D|nr:hypothetical protein [Streptomyces atratus]MCX5339245.1 hypothetical protein [Streptomyces atratus]
MGRQVTTLALALLAVTRLGAGPFGASALMALSYLPGALLGVLPAGPFAATIGLALETRICAVVAALAIFLVPTASLGFGFPALLSYQFLFGLSATVWAISMTTTQQLITARAPGPGCRVLQAALIGTVPIGALGGGALAGWLGSIPVLTGGATVALLAAACLWLP